MDALTRIDDAVVAGDAHFLLAVAQDRASSAYHSYLTDEPAQEILGDAALPYLATSPCEYTRQHIAQDRRTCRELLVVLTTDRCANVAATAHQALRQREISRNAA